LGIKDTIQRLKQITGQLEKEDKKAENSINERSDSSSLHKNEIDIEKFREDLNSLEESIDKVSQNQSNLKEVDAELLALSKEAVRIVEEHNNVPLFYVNLASQKKNMGNNEEFKRMKSEAESSLMKLDQIIQLVEELIYEEDLELHSQEKSKRIEKLQNTKEELEEFRKEFMEEEKEEMNEISRS
jgi:hypothetical protein